MFLTTLHRFRNVLPVTAMGLALLAGTALGLPAQPEKVPAPSSPTTPAKPGSKNEPAAPPKTPTKTPAATPPRNAGPNHPRVIRPPTTPAVAAAQADATVAEFGARNVARIAFSDLGLQDNPMARDHRLTAILIGIAQELSPDERYLRWRLSAASLAEDRPLAIALCRELLQKDPKDTVLQYRLISLMLEDARTAEDRLARLRRMVGPEGASLDASVRSRLAMDAAGLCQQLGDDAGFVELLKLATTLDSTNRDAAATAAAYYADRVDDPIGRLELLANLLLAEPTDPETQLAIARELAAIGAFEQAARFQDNVTRVLDHERIPAPPALARERLFSRWGMEGPKVVVDQINNQIEGYRQQTARQLEAMEKALVSTAGVPRPDEVRLEILMERLRLIAAVSAGDTTTAEKSVADLRATAAARLRELGDVRARPAEIDDAKAAELGLLMKLGVIEAMSWANMYAPQPAAAAGASDAGAAPASPPPAPATDAAADAGKFPGPPGGAALAEIEQLAAQNTIEPGNLDFQTARGWALVRAGKLDEAITVLEGVGDQRVGAQLGLGEAYKLKGDKDKSIAAYRLVWRGVPQSLEAMYAYSALRELLGRSDVEPELVRRAKGFASGVPSWIDRISEGGHTFMSLEVESKPAQTSGLERSAVRLKLRNISPVPLGVGVDRALNSQVLVGSSMEVGISSVRAYLTPEVASLARRLRLMPNESIEIMYWPDGGSAGWVVEECCDRMIRQRWRAVQGYVQADDGSISTGPLCIARETGAQVRLALSDWALTPAELAQKLGTAGEDQLGAVAALIRAKLLNPLNDDSGVAKTVTEPDVNAIAAAAAARYPTLSAHGRLMLAAVLPQAAIVPGMKAFDEATKAETDPMAAVVVLVSRVEDPADPFLAACRQSTDPRLSQAAEILAERLTAGVSGYASRGGPDVRGMIQDSQATRTDDGIGLTSGGGR